MGIDGSAAPIHLTPDEWRAIGRQIRADVSHADLGRSEIVAHKRDPLAVVWPEGAGGAAQTPPADVLAMTASPLAFLRGAGALMAADLSASAITGLTVQAVGDARLGNFAVVLTPRRDLVVDVVDYGNTVRAPWEWDVKRLVVSVVLTAADHGSDDTGAEVMARRAARAYRRSLRKLARLRTLDLWRARADGSRWARTAAKRHDAELEARAKFLDAVPFALGEGLVEIIDERPRFSSISPLLTPLRDVEDGDVARDVRALVSHCYVTYRAGLPPERRHLLDRFRLVDIAFVLKASGPAIAVLFIGRDTEDPLVLCLEEARASALEPFVESDAHAGHGERIAEALRLLEATEDPFVGASAPTDDGRQFYWRKLPAAVAFGETLPADARALERCAVACARCLAHIHARTGDPIAMAAYLGSGKTFDQAMASFAADYAEQTVRDWRTFTADIADATARPKR